MRFQVSDGDQKEYRGNDHDSSERGPFRCVLAVPATGKRPHGDSTDPVLFLNRDTAASGRSGGGDGSDQRRKPTGGTRLCWPRRTMSVEASAGERLSNSPSGPPVSPAPSRASFLFVALRGRGVFAFSENDSVTSRLPVASLNSRALKEMMTFSCRSGALLFIET